MKSILITVLMFSVISAKADTTCASGALGESFGLFQSKNVCNIKTLEHISSNIRKVESNCKIKHSNFEDFLLESCQFGDESSCAKQKKIGKYHSKTESDTLIKLTSREELHKRFEGLMGMISDRKDALNDNPKTAGRSIASVPETEKEVIADCLDAFRGYESEMQKWQQEHAHIRKRSIRAR